MAIVKKYADENKDRNGGLGKAILQADVRRLIYRVRYNARYCNSNINIVNPNATEARVKLWLTYDDTPGLEDLIESSIVLQPDAVYVRTNMVIGPSEAVYALSDSDGVICRVEGFENNLLA